MAGTDDYRITERYAAAWFSLAKEAGALPATENDLAKIISILKIKEFYYLLHTPLLARTRKAEVLASVLSQAGLSETSRRFFRTLALNQRLSALPGIVVAFQRRLAAHQGETVARITTARAQTPAALNTIAEALGAALGKKLKAEPHVNPALIGGMVVDIAGTRIDDSVAGKLNRLTRALKTA